MLGRRGRRDYFCGESGPGNPAGGLLLGRDAAGRYVQGQEIEGQGGSCAAS